MLLSPGHSPRHIATPPSAASPGQTLAPVPSAATPAGNPRKRRHVVLDEDTYVAAIERIIERDYFPDIPKLRDRLDWLEAVRSRDPVLIRDVQLKILERRSAAAHPSSVASAAPEATATPGVAGRTQTPGSSFYPFSASATPFGSDRTTLDAARLSDGSKDPALEGGDSVDVSLSLDDFFRRHTSEDNESFSKILEKVNRKRQERFAHLLERDGEDPSKALEVEGRDRITDGFGSSGQPVDSLEGWKYTAKNLLMYNSAEGEVPLTEAERAERIMGLTKEINISNTRFGSKSVSNSKPSKEDGVTVLYTMVPGTSPAGAAWPFADREAERFKKYDLEELRRTPNQFYVESTKEAVKGYKFVRTPSPAPGVDESPFMTWGEIEGTPLRLDLDDNPVEIGGSSEGPRFSIPLPPSRDVKAHSLSREAARKLRERSRMFQKPLLPSPARGGSASPSVRTLSPAAQKFVRNAIAKSSHTVDETLRASYRGSSPVIGTPKERKSATRFSRDGSLGSRSPSARQDSALPW
uniref:Protein DGCR14 n=1 Tax=Anthurium amnicola TaxID=1678845 RepID=A0A1D1YXA5_9ARAE